MDPKKARAKHGPEYGIQARIVQYLYERGWHVERIVGLGIQFGLPDLYITHPKWGQRWLEVKCPDHYTFTRHQKRKFPILDHYGTGIWILTAATDDEYQRLFKLPNWRDYWKPEWGSSEIVEDGIDALLDELNKEEWDRTHGI
jgi:hypothetical protein